MEEITLHVQLKAKSLELGGYITYVFENLNCHDWEFQYIMCVQFPNWNQSEIKINDIGYVNVRYVKEGISQWYDGEKMNVYKYTNVVFLKFIEEPKNVNIDFIVD
jgi:hypothetical protein